ncbi:Annexin-B10, putative [Pediculus humanus corporis]|uniref:Annexin n=1 Tax=Pediculus humanus subsp. corporis TaxID=121224 RepID=E0VM42_PEDHC|nr:Annexin-B10, putative [Pediculus humanus corporis]EEB14448.1 Annexin-B10, putative [Pediculus humanus corporis]
MISIVIRICLILFIFLNFRYEFRLRDFVRLKMALDYTPVPTIRPYPNFNAAEDGTALREAMKGFGTDEEAIIGILTNRSNSQRQEIAKFFTEEYGRNLLEDLKKELGGNFEDLILALMIPPVEYLCKQLNKAIKGLGTDDSCLIEILCSRSNQQIQEIVDCYEAKYNRPFAEHLCSDTSGDFRRFLTLIVTGVRKDATNVDPDAARELAEKLYASGEGKLGTDEEVFNKIFAHESFPQLRLIFEEYKNIGGRTIEQAIKNELSGNMKEAMLATVECVQHPPTFFAKRLHSAMAGMGTDDVTLIRIIVCRSEIDLENIKLEYERLYEKTLESAVRSETHGHYKRALLSIINAKAQDE